MVLAHTRFGEGRRPVVLLHGFLGSARNLTSLARGLVGILPDAAIVGLDLTGHGMSPPLPPGADLGTLADDVLQTARALALPRPLAIVGHSLGGRVALRACLLDRAAVDDVVLLDITPSPGPTAGDVPRILATLLRAPESAPTRDVLRAHLRADGLQDALVDWLLLNLQRDGEAYRWRVDRAALARLHERAGREDLWPAVEGPRRGRVRCVRGGRSPYVTAADAARLQAAGCAVVTVEGAGHFLHVERPAEVVEAVAQGLSTDR